MDEVLNLIQTHIDVAKDTLEYPNYQIYSYQEAINTLNLMDKLLEALKKV